MHLSAQPGLCPTGSVAQGSWELNSGPKIWDFAGAQLLIEEAGGVVLDPSGGPFDIMGRSVFVASSMALAQELLEVFKEAAPAQVS